MRAARGEVVLHIFVCVKLVKREHNMHNEPALEKLILTNNPSITMTGVVVFTITLLHKFTALH